MLKFTAITDADDVMHAQDGESEATLCGVAIVTHGPEDENFPGCEECLRLSGES